MAEFNKAIEPLLENEGLYSNDPKDSGGETVWGVSRNNFPDIPLWGMVDKLKGSIYFPDNIRQNDEIKKAVREFYYANFWQPIKANEIFDQTEANNLFDFAVNSGSKQAVKIAQRALNVIDDGVVGLGTLLALNDCDPEIFILRFKIEKIKFYCSIVDNKPEQIRFLKGWIKRALK